MLSLNAHFVRRFSCFSVREKKGKNDACVGTQKYRLKTVGMHADGRCMMHRVGECLAVDGHTLSKRFLQ